MSDMMDFSLWLLDNLPDFLLKPPISAFVGLFILFFIARLVRYIIHISL